MVHHWMCHREIRISICLTLCILALAGMAHPHLLNHGVNAALEFHAAKPVELAIVAQDFVSPQEIGIIGSLGQIADTAFHRRGRDVRSARASSLHRFQ